MACTVGVLPFWACPWFGALGCGETAGFLARVREADPILLSDGCYPYAFCCGYQGYG
ncbi:MULTISPECIES: hypothetical protein [Bartonella]|uniref:hypothetical protein n=1 Tax=Bartonella TaxID=773 RepID=UPI00236132C1|nr:MULTISPECIES: hypothetical protein [Bartonella]